MFSQRDLRFVLCSLDLDVLRAQRSMGFLLNLTTHKSTRSENPITWMGSGKDRPGRQAAFLFPVCFYYLCNGPHVL